jgi:hypothetical protein
MHAVTSHADRLATFRPTAIWGTADRETTNSR